MKRSIFSMFIFCLVLINVYGKSQNSFIDSFDMEILNTRVRRIVDRLNEKVPNTDKIALIGISSDDSVFYEILDIVFDQLKTNISDDNIFSIVDQNMITIDRSEINDGMALRIGNNTGANTVIVGHFYSNSNYLSIKALNVDEGNDQLLSALQLPRIRDISNQDSNFTFGINTNVGGLIPLGETLRMGGPSINMEFAKNNFYSIINLSIPIDYFEKNVGFGFSGIFHYLWNSRIGDFYLGGGVGYTYYTSHYFTFGASAGYRYITQSGMFFNAGVYIGGKVGNEFELDLKPVIGVGYVF